MIVGLHDLAPLIPPVDAELRPPVLQRAEHLQPASTKPRPHVVDAALHRVVGRSQHKPELLIDTQQLLAVVLTAPTCRRINDTRDPPTTREYGLSMNCRLRLSSVINSL